MSLGSGEWLLGDNQSVRDTYCLILTICTSAVFQLVTMNHVGRYGTGVCYTTPDPRNDETEV